LISRIFGGRDLREEDLIEAEIGIKRASDIFRKRALELKRQYESTKSEIIRDIKSGVGIDNPTLLSKARLAIKYSKDAIMFYQDYTNLLLLIEEIKNLKARIEALGVLKESEVIDILKNKLNPKLREALRGATTLNALIRGLTEYGQSIRPEIATEVTDEEIKSFLSSLALQASVETTTTGKPAEASLKDVLERLERELNSIR